MFVLLSSPEKYVHFTQLIVLSLSEPLKEVICMINVSSHFNHEIGSIAKNVADFICRELI